MNTPLKVLTILGTRPEIIRLSRVMAKLDHYTTHIVVHTGQNYDYELNEVFFKEMQVRKPDYYLGADCSTPAKAYGNILIAIEPILIKEKPDAVLILGDTNSSIAALIAKRLRIPIYHMEAGNRCFDLNVPEETNRKIIDHTSDFNIVYTEHARRNLLREGIHPRRLYLSGSPMKEVLDHHLPQIEASPILNTLQLTARQFFVVSMHREENVDNAETLVELISCLNCIHEQFGMPIVVSAHPRTKKRIEALPNNPSNPAIMWMKPFGFFDYVKLQMNSFCTISDSGTISEESALLLFPAITIRNAIERPEAMDSGTITVVGHDATTIINAIGLVVGEHKDSTLLNAPKEYRIDNVSGRVVKLILGTAHLSNQWDGICSPAK